MKKRPYVMTARAAKAEATRERIRSTALELYCERPIENFTLEEVAARAGTTVQTVLRAFGSKEDLFFEALGELSARGQPLKLTPPGDIAAAIGAIFDLYETMGDLVVRNLSDEQRYPRLKPQLDRGRASHRNWVRTVFAPQLAPCDGSARTELLNALIAATDVYVWKLLRRDRGLSRPAAEAVVRSLVTGVSTREKTDGKDSLVELVGRRQPSA